MPFYTQVIHNVRDATHVLDGLLYHDTNLDIEEHYTDTAGFTDHVFALCHLLGFRFAPRIRDLKEKKLFYADKNTLKTNLKPLLGERLRLDAIRDNWEQILRLTSSVKMGTVQASLMLRKLSAYPRQNSLALALRELGRLERTLFILKWIQEPQLRRNVLIGLNKGELKHSLADAICFYRQGIIRDRDYTDQLHRASSLNLVIAAMVLWNTLYLEMAVQDMQRLEPVSEEVLNHLSPMRWQHIRLSGDYVWKKRKQSLTRALY
jgi:TnpA family transposase